MIYSNKFSKVPLEKTIDKVLRLGNFKSFDWANHLAYKERMRAYERF